MDGRTGKFQGLPQRSLAVLLFPSSHFGTVLRHGQHLHICSGRRYSGGEDPAETDRLLRSMGACLVVLCMDASVPPQPAPLHLLSWLSSDNNNPLLNCHFQALFFSPSNKSKSIWSWGPSSTLMAASLPPGIVSNWHYSQAFRSLAHLNSGNFSSSNQHCSDSTCHFVGGGALWGSGSRDCFSADVHYKT